MVLRAVFSKELHSYFGLFLAYAIVAVALALCGFFFYTDISFFMMWGGQNLERGLWEFFFHDLRGEPQENGGPASYTIRADQKQDVRPAVVEAVTSRGWRLFELRSREMDLEEIFHRVV